MKCNNCMQDVYFPEDVWVAITVRKIDEELYVPFQYCEDCSSRDISLIKELS